MKAQTYISKAAVVIDAPIEKVWEALVHPPTIKKYMFGTTVVSDWKEGSPIQWKGEWKGKAYEDKGTIVRFEPLQLLQYTHFSPLAGEADVPENYHTVTIRLKAEGAGTGLELTQDNNASEEAKKHTEQNWQTMLGSLKKLLEEGS